MSANATGNATGSGSGNADANSDAEADGPLHAVAGSPHDLARLILTEENVHFYGELRDQDDISSVTQALAQTTTLRNLLLRIDSYPTDDGAVRLADAVGRNDTVQELGLHYHGDTVYDGSQAFDNLLLHNTTLRSLNLQGIVDDAGARAIANGLGHNSTLRELYLNYCRIGNDGLIAIADALRHNSTLQKLFLCRNRIGDDGLIAMADTLRHNSTLLTLDFESHSVGGVSEVGATALAGLLRHNDAIEVLRLGYCSIGSAGASALANALTNNNTLQELNLEYCGFGDEGVVAFANALKLNRGLQELILQGNNTSQATAELFGDVLRYDNTTITWLSVDWSYISLEIAEKIDRLAEINKESVDCTPQEVAKKKRAEFGPTVNDIYPFVRSFSYLLLDD